MSGRPHRFLPIIIPIGILSVGGYLVVSHLIYSVGFPLDDAWIHQTYARNLWENRAWEFIPNVPSAGSTAPLWTVGLAFGYGLGLDANWAYMLGFLLLLLLAFLCSIWLRNRQPELRGQIWWVGLLVLIEWHLVWAAVSGMEILLSAGLILLVFYWLDAELGKPVLLGLLIGIGIWIRPDLVLLVIPVSWGWFWQRLPDWRGATRCGISLMAGVGVGFLPYAAFNLLIGGTILPNTFFAKQAEYAILVERGFLSRLMDQFMVPLVGVGVVLLPGVIYSSYRAVQDRQLQRLAPQVWVLTMMVLYALRLPVTYQHGRYLMPTIPVWIVLGFEGLTLWIRPDSAQILRRVASRAWPIILALVGGTFWYLGARAYARDVAIIETEMVASAEWIAAHTAPDSLIAAHDIGALGYFGERRILDLAGLISPEVIPFIRDESELEDYLAREDADYLMTFPGWYPQLVADRSVVFVTGAKFSPAAGGENMAVYKLE